MLLQRNFSLTNWMPLLVKMIRKLLEQVPTCFGGLKHSKKPKMEYEFFAAGRYFHIDSRYFFLTQFTVYFVVTVFIVSLFLFMH